MPETLIIPNRPFWARALIFLCVIELGMGLLFVIAGITHSSGLVIVLGALITALFLGLATFGLPIAILTQPAIEMRPDGLLDRRFSQTLIPWEAISWKVVFNGRSYSLKFDVAEPTRQALALSPMQRLSAALSRAWRHPEFTLHTLGTGLSAHQLGEKLKNFKAPSA